MGVKPGCETWVLTTSDENQLYIFERKILRKIYGPKERFMGQRKIQMEHGELKQMTS